ncbi:MAG: hypothetical protein AAFY58_08840 [Planctomycetota bacterium]
MKAKQFDKLIRAALGPVLEPLGFTAAESKRSTFTRRVANEHQHDDIVHVVLPDRSTRGNWFDVRVFPTSPHVNPLFDLEFPDDLGFPTQSSSLLSEEGVGIRQTTFSCSREDSVQKAVDLRLGRLLREHAVPYLNQFQTVEDMLPFIQHHWPRAFALDHLGRTEEARDILRANLHRLPKYDPNDETIRIYNGRVYAILGMDPPSE